MIKRIWKAIVKGWKAFAMFMAKVNTFLLMFLIYFLIVPFFSLWRLKDPLRVKLKKDMESYWMDKKPLDTSVEGMKKLY